jgi:hypothetical protein
LYLFFFARLLYMFRVLSAPIIRSTIKTAGVIIGTIHVSVWFKSFERCPRSGVYFTVSWPSCIYSSLQGVLLMMGAESTGHMWSKLAEKNKYNCLKQHHVGYLIK